MSFILNVNMSDLNMSQGLPQNEELKLDVLNSDQAVNISGDKKGKITIKRDANRRKPMSPAIIKDELVKSDIQPQSKSYKPSKQNDFEVFTTTETVVKQNVITEEDKEKFTWAVVAFCLVAVVLVIIVIGLVKYVICK